MARIEMNVDEYLESMTRDGMKRFVRKLLEASDKDERRLVNALSKPGKNDLADLVEETRGKPNAPQVEDDDLPYDGEDELPDVPKAKKGK